MPGHCCSITPGMQRGNRIREGSTCAGCCVVAVAQAEPGNEVVRVGQVGVGVAPAKVLFGLAVHAARRRRAQLLARGKPPVIAVVVFHKGMRMLARPQPAVQQAGCTPLQAAG